MRLLVINTSYIQEPESGFGFKPKIFCSIKLYFVPYLGVHRAVVGAGLDVDEGPGNPSD